MSVETDADLATFFNEDEFAEAAVYRPAGVSPPAAGTACSVIVDRGQGRRGFEAGDLEARTVERLVQVRVTEIAAVARGGTFTMLDEEGIESAEVLLVAGLPQRDETGRWWVCEVTLPD